MVAGGVWFVLYWFGVGRLDWNSYWGIVECFLFFGSYFSVVVGRFVGFFD